MVGDVSLLRNNGAYANSGSSYVAHFGSSYVAHIGSSDVAHFGSSHIWYKGHFGHYKWRMCAKVKIFHTITTTKNHIVCVRVRRNTSILHSINPEIDRTHHRLVRQNRTLDTNFVYVSEHVVAENTTSEHSVFMHSEYSNFVHFVAFPNFDHYVHSENMAQPTTPPGPRERTLRELAAPDFTYDSLCIQYEDLPYVLKTRLIHLLPKFNGLAGQDPHKHLK
ncbi:hypothetical protein Lal_00011274 [Lupinus albus]|nr:hypothetical protein Lal_00011274 [Lupinus albus]